MLKLEFTNAVVKDHGYGLIVNGKCLDDIISIALGTKDGKDNRAEFESNCCNVTVIIDPQPVTVHIEDDEFKYDSVEELEEDKHEQFKKNAKTNSKK